MTRPCLDCRAPTDFESVDHGDGRPPSHEGACPSCGLRMYLSADGRPGAYPRGGRPLFGPG